MYAATALLGVTLMVTQICFIAFVAHHRRMMAGWQDRFERMHEAFKSMESANAKNEATVRSLLNTARTT